MGRQQSIARSIVRAIITGEHEETQGLLARILTAFTAFFAIYQLRLKKIGDELFSKLRGEEWHIDEDDYEFSFWRSEDEKLGSSIKPKGDMGFSGSVS